ncbi:hypothetical protein B0H19DRAFT_1273237 [Mycena capillaripes]|nr:hypothetical protein B0H19DRAFT_1273237 [Mycena capillaripes]
MLEKKIPVPSSLTRKILEDHPGWECDDTDTALIKKTVHQIIEDLLDETKSMSDQKPMLLEEVYRRAADMFPVLRNYADNWATRCIVQAHLKATAAIASNKAVQEAVVNLANTVQSGGARTRGKSTKQVPQNAIVN